MYYSINISNSYIFYCIKLVIFTLLKVHFSKIGIYIQKSQNIFIFCNIHIKQHQKLFIILNIIIYKKFK